MAGGSFGTGVGHSRGDSSYGGRGDNTPGSGDRGGNSSDRNDPRQGRGYGTDYSKQPGYGGSSNTGGGNSGNNQAPAPQAAPSRSLGSLRAELDRRDRAAVAALGGLTGGVNQASLAFNDDEEGINSIGEALDRFGAWAKDQVGLNNPRGFLGSNVASLGAGILGGMVAGPLGMSIGATATKVAADPKPSRNMIGYAANALGGMPGVGGLVASGVSLLDDNVVDLDKVNPSQLGGIAGATASAAASTPGLTSFPGGRQGGDNPVLRQTANTALSASRTGGNQTAKPKPNPNTIRRTFSPLNISYARLRGIEDLL
ncbi:hypothetical protein [Thalassospira aquimaris]|uniref:Uncharacterized protein n=1 Tax=Thalassospira aquimaris TaxID=3037796 RepID=A0ABT6GHM8_9PROT|nr:hypothetical protein [Thalassospira sp. FZY0004]MDG4721597.1 hypothetical protein [Thalassospira sp. FZY0004]